MLAVKLLLKVTLVPVNPVTYVLAGSPAIEAPLPETNCPIAMFAFEVTVIVFVPLVPLLTELTTAVPDAP